MINKMINFVDDAKNKVKHKLKDLEQGDLAKAQKLLDNVSAKMRKDHPIFPWYMQSEYTTDKPTYASSFPGACLLEATKTLMHALGIDIDKISDLQLLTFLGWVVREVEICIVSQKH